MYWLGFGRQRAVERLIVVVDEDGKEFLAIEGSAAGGAVVSAGEALPAEWGVFYQWRCPQGGRTGCEAGWRQWWQWKRGRAGVRRSSSSNIYYMQMKIDCKALPFVDIFDSNEIESTEAAP
jgi:hypothetical protein